MVNVGREHRSFEHLFCRIFPIANRDHIGNMKIRESRSMLILDAPMLVAIATLISSISAFVWAVRRKP